MKKKHQKDIRITLRLPVEIHEKLQKELKKMTGFVSQNQIIIECLAKCLNVSLVKMTQNI